MNCVYIASDQRQTFTPAKGAAWTSALLVLRYGTVDGGGNVTDVGPCRQVPIRDISKPNTSPIDLGVGPTFTPADVLAVANDAANAGKVVSQWT